MNIEKEEVTQQKYQEIAQLIGVDNPPKLIVDTAGLRKKGLVGLYQRNHKNGEITITLREWGETNEFEEKAIVIHEITHYLLDKQGYHAGAHGWPFLAVCALLSHKVGIHSDYIMFSNIRNWQGMALLKTWEKHATLATQLAHRKINSEPEKLQKMTANEITIDVLSNQKIKINRLPTKYTMVAHNYFANTKGAEIMLFNISKAGIIAGFIMTGLGIQYGIHIMIYGVMAWPLALVVILFRGLVRKMKEYHFKIKQRISQSHAEIRNT